MIIDKPLAELKQYKSSLTRQHDFDAFWEQTLSESADQPLNATLQEKDRANVARCWPHLTILLLHRRARTNNGVYFLTTWNFTVLSVNRPQRMAIPSSPANMGPNAICANTMSQLIPWV